MVGAGPEGEGKQTAGWDKTASKYFTCSPSPFLAANTPLPVTGCPHPIPDPLSSPAIARAVAPAKPPPHLDV